MKKTLKIINFKKEEYTQRDEELIENRFARYIKKMKEDPNLDYILDFSKTKFIDPSIYRNIIEFIENYKKIDLKQDKTPQVIFSRKFMIFWNVLASKAYFKIHYSTNKCLEKNNVKIKSLEESL